MTLTVQRLRHTTDAIFGELRLDDLFECYTLEPSATAEHPAIPPGTYKVALLPSVRFGQIVPHVLDVPGRTAIEVHPGNSPSETLGCVLVGRVLAPDAVLESRDAFLALMTKLEDAGGTYQLTVLPEVA